MATITADHIASVSLKDADRNPDEFAEKLGRSFEDYGFAIIADHGIPDELIHRAEDKAKAFFALPEEVKRKYHHPRRRRRARLHAVRDRDRQGRQGARPQGILARRPRPAAPATSSARTCRDNVWPAEVPELPATPSATLRRLRRAPACKILRGDRALSGARRGLFRRHGARRQFGAAPAPLSADRRADRPAHPRRRARGHQHHHPAARRRGSGAELLTKDGRWLPVSPRPGELVGQHRRHAAAADQRPAALDHPPRGQSAARARAAMRAIRCRSSCTSAPIS